MTLCIQKTRCKVCDGCGLSFAVWLVCTFENRRASRRQHAVRLRSISTVWHPLLHLPQWRAYSPWISPGNRRPIFNVPRAATPIVSPVTNAILPDPSSGRQLTEFARVKWTTLRHVVPSKGNLVHVFPLTGDSGRFASARPYGRRDFRSRKISRHGFASRPII